MRFAHEHAPSPPSRWFWIAVAGIFLALALPVVVLNLIADPLDARLTRHLPAYRKKIFIQKDIILWSVAEISRIPSSILDRVTLVMAGDSRIDTLTSWIPNGRVVKIGDDYLLNLGVGSSSFDETMQMLEAELPRLPQLRGVVIGAPIERFGTLGAASRVPAARRMFDFPTGYLVNLRTFAWSIELLRSQAVMKWRTPRAAASFELKSIPDVSAAVFDPSAKQRANLAETTVVTADDGGFILYRDAFSSLDFDLVRRRIDTDIAPLVKELARRKIKVVFFLPPLRPKVRKMAGPDIDAIQRRYVEMIAPLGVIEDFTVGAKDGIEPRFRDVSHVFPATAKVLLADIYLRNFAPRSPSAPEPLR